MGIVNGVFWVAMIMMALDVVLRAAAAGAIGPILALIPIIISAASVEAIRRNCTNKED